MCIRDSPRTPPDRRLRRKWPHSGDHRPLGRSGQVPPARRRRQSGASEGAVATPVRPPLPEVPVGGSGGSGSPPGEATRAGAASRG
eukprot:12617280-Alexandrium_andersonii.AAC.1